MGVLVRGAINPPGPNTHAPIADGAQEASASAANATPDDFNALPLILFIVSFIKNFLVPPICISSGSLFVAEK